MFCSFSGCRRRLVRVSVLSNRIQLPLQRQLVQRTQRKTGEDRYAIIEHAVGVRESKAKFGLIARGGGGVRHAPVRSHGLPCPDRARLRRGIVTQGEEEIDLAPSGGGEPHPFYAR